MAARMGITASMALDEAIQARIEAMQIDDPLSRAIQKVGELTLPAQFSLESMNEFIGWNRSSPYKVERGEGECAI